MLEDQIDGQTRRTEEVEKSLRERQAECRRLEEVAAKERRDRTAQELRTGELKTEVDEGQRCLGNHLMVQIFMLYFSGGKLEAEVCSA